MEPEGSIPHSQEPSTGPYPELYQSNPHHPILKIHFDIVHTPTSWSSQWSLSFWLSHQYSTSIPLLPYSCYMPRQSNPSWLDHSNYTWRRVQVMKLLVMQVSPVSCQLLSKLQQRVSQPFQSQSLSKNILKIKFVLRLHHIRQLVHAGFFFFFVMLQLLVHIVNQCNLNG
jgi:hypothetical protein